MLASCAEETPIDRAAIAMQRMRDEKFRIGRACPRDAGLKTAPRCASELNRKVIGPISKPLRMAGRAECCHASGLGPVSMPNAIAIWWIVSQDGRSEMYSAAAPGLC